MCVMGVLRSSLDLAPHGSSNFLCFPGKRKTLKGLKSQACPGPPCQGVIPLSHTLQVGTHKLLQDQISLPPTLSFFFWSTFYVCLTMREPKNPLFSVVMPYVKLDKKETLFPVCVITMCSVMYTYIIGIILYIKLCSVLFLPHYMSLLILCHKKWFLYNLKAYKIAL